MSMSYLRRTDNIFNSARFRLILSFSASRSINTGSFLFIAAHICRSVPEYVDVKNFKNNMMFSALLFR